MKGRREGRIFWAGSGTEAALAVSIEGRGYGEISQAVARVATGGAMGRRAEG